MKTIRKAVIPVAGYGTRFLPYTKAVPKPMLPILNKPAIQVIAEEAVKSGIEEIMFVVGQKKEIIENHFKPFEELEKVLNAGGKLKFLEAIKTPETMAKFYFGVQKRQRGTADAVLTAKEFVGNEPFAVMFGDDVMHNDGTPVLKQLINCYSKKNRTIIGVKRVPLKDVPKYASVEYDSQEDRLYSITHITEKPAPEKVKSDLSPLGRYILAPTMIDLLEKLEPSVGGELQLTDALSQDAEINGAYAYEFEGTRYDMGDRLGFLKANVEYGLRDEELKEAFNDYLRQLIK